MGLLMWGAVAGAVLNIVLTALLASVYARNARKVPTMFTAGLLTFAVLLLVGNAVTLWSFATMMPVYPACLEPYVITYTWAQAAGLLALSVVTWKQSQGPPRRESPEQGRQCLRRLDQMVDTRGLQVRPGAVAPCDADRPGAGLLGGTHIVLRVSDDDAFGRGDAESLRRLQDGIGKGLLARNGVAAQDEGEERQQRRDTEGLDGRVVTLVRDRGEPPGSQGRERLWDSRIRAHAIVDGLRLDLLEHADGLREVVPREAASLLVDRLDRRADPSGGLGAAHRRTADRREARVEGPHPGVEGVEEGAVDVEQDRAATRHVRSPPRRAAICRRRHGGASRSPCPSPHGPSSDRP